MAQQVTSISGKRGYWRYLYGSHGWIPLTDADWSGGMYRDGPRDVIPPGRIYDATDFLLHQPGRAQKRGGTSVEGTMAAGTYAQAVKFCEFPAASKIIAINNLGAIYSKATAGLSPMSALGGSTVSTVDTPKFRIGGAKTLLVIANSDGTTAPTKYDGTAAPAALGGTPPAGKYADLYKSRLALGGSSANPNRVYFSPTPDIESAWDTTNSWIDCDYAVTGMAALQNALLVFSAGHMERITGTTPPPNTDMDREVIGAFGCIDARSICVYGGLCYFANEHGIYETNGIGFNSLTDKGGIGSYWRSLLPTSINSRNVSATVYRDHLFVSIYDSGTGAIVDALMCYLPKLAWWRITNVTSVMWATSNSDRDEIYYADRSTAKVVRCREVFLPTSSNKADYNSTNVLPTLEFRPLGDLSGDKRFGDAWLTYDMADAASDNPTLAITVKTGLKADVSTTPSESPLAETTTSQRKRFSVRKEAEMVTIALAQSNPSANTDIYRLDVEHRGLPISQESPAA